MNRRFSETSRAMDPDAGPVRPSTPARDRMLAGLVALERDRPERVGVVRRVRGLGTTGSTCATCARWLEGGP